MQEGAFLLRYGPCAGAIRSFRRRFSSISDLFTICSHFVVCNADSTMQVVAIADGVEEAVEEKLGEKVWRVEGKQTGLWVAMDYMDVVVHIFTTELRSFYKLEELWADAPLKRYDYEE